MNRKIIISKNASKSLQDIADYIEYKWSLKTRYEFIDKFGKNIKLIQSNPESFPKSTINNDLHKCVITKQTSIFYKFNSNTIRILQVFDTRQDPNKLK